MAHRLSRPCRPYATPSSNSSLNYSRSDARTAENGFATSGSVSKSAKVVLDCAVFLPRRSLPENANAGTLITASFRKQTGGVVTRVLRLRAVNEANGVVPCDEIDEAGINTTDRVMERLM